MILTTFVAFVAGLSFTEFAHHSDIATSQPTSIVVGQINERVDLNLDFVVTDWFNRSIVVFQGDGDVGFLRAATLPVPAKPFSVALGDLNGDGHLDIAVVAFETTLKSTSFTTEIANQPRLLAFWGNGRGSFRPMILDLPEFVASDTPWCLTATDRDIFYSNFLTPNIVRLRRDGPPNSGYRLHGTPSPSFAKPVGLAIGQINSHRDDFPDLVTVQRETGRLRIYLAETRGGLRPSFESSGGENPWSVALGDFDGDGSTDAVTANRRSSSLLLLQGDGEGLFLPGVSFPVPDPPIGVASADLNGDGLADVMTTSVEGNQISIWLARAR